MAIEEFVRAKITIEAVMPTHYLETVMGKIIGLMPLTSTLSLDVEEQSVGD